MSRKRTARKSKEMSRSALRANLFKIGNAIVSVPKYLLERLRLNRTIYLGRKSLVRTVRDNNLRIEAISLRYRMAIANLPYGEKELGFDTYWWTYSVQITSQWLLNLANPSRWRIRRFEETAWSKKKEDWARPTWRLILWEIVADISWLTRNLLNAVLAASWFLYMHLLRHPRNSHLTSLREQLRMLVATQEELILEIKRIISADGEETPIAAQTRLLQERDQEAKKKAEEQDRMNRFLTARENFTRAFEELQAEQAENPIDSHAQLQFSILETYIQAGFAEMDSLVGEGKPIPEEKYIDAMNRTIEELQHSFRFWAGSVAKDRQSYGIVMESLEHLKADFGEFDPPPQAVRISYLFREEVPNLWGNAEWSDLQIRLKDIREMLNQIADFAREFRNWGKRVRAIQERVAKTEETRESILGRYGKEHEVHPSREWIDAWKSFETKALPALAQSDWNTLNECLLKIDEPLRVYEYKVISGLELAHRLATGKDDQKKGEDMTRGTGTRFARRRISQGARGEDSPAEKPQARAIGERASSFRPTFEDGS